jgi:hypothetical protein
MLIKTTIFALLGLTTHRIFLLGLAVSDFIVCSVTVPFEIIDVEHSHTFHSTEACKVFRSLNYLFIFTSILMLMALSLDRFLRVFAIPIMQ